MNNQTDFTSGLLYLASYFWKLIIIIAIILFITITVNLILKKINFSWSQKFVKKLDSIITSAEGLKSIVKSFEKLIDILFNAIAGLIRLFGLFIEAAFISVNKFLLSPLEILISYMNILARKMEKFNHKLNKNTDDSLKEIENIEYKKNNDKTLIENILSKKSKNNE